MTCPCPWDTATQSNVSMRPWAKIPRRAPQFDANGFSWPASCWDCTSMVIWWEPELLGRIECYWGVCRVGAKRVMSRECDGGRRLVSLRLLLLLRLVPIEQPRNRPILVTSWLFPCCYFAVPIAVGGLWHRHKVQNCCASRAEGAPRKQHEANFDRWKFEKPTSVCSRSECDVSRWPMRLHKAKCKSKESKIHSFEISTATTNDNSIRVDNILCPRQMTTNAPRIVLGLVLALGCLLESGSAFQSIGLPLSRNVIPTVAKQQQRWTQLHQSSKKGFPEVARPDPSILISAKDDKTQKLAVLGIGAGILAGTAAVVNILNFLDDILPFGFLDSVLGFLVPVPLGLLFCLVGYTHFSEKDAYMEIVPPKGTWGGLWQIPAPKSEDLGLSYSEYHVLWSGVAEIGGGLLLALGGIGAFPIQIAAFLMFLLVLAVTPANIYMFTHDAQLSVAPAFEYPTGHIARAAIQCVVLALLWHFIFVYWYWYTKRLQ